jgi:signal transduction histidine kinase
MVLQEALQLAAEAVRPAATQRGQALRVFVPTPAITLQADAVRVHQMVVNLLGNAIKYTPEGGQIGVIVLSVQIGAPSPSFALADKDLLTP